jgi:hypothetical protein
MATGTAALGRSKSNIVLIQEISLYYCTPETDRQTTTNMKRKLTYMERRTRLQNEDMKYLFYCLFTTTTTPPTGDLHLRYHDHNIRISLGA